METTEKVQKVKDMKFAKRMKIKMITKLQKMALRSNIEYLAADVYYYLARWHFRVYVDGTDTLERAVIASDDIGIMAARRHARLVINTLFPNMPKADKKWIKAAARGIFVKNIILRARL